MRVFHGLLKAESAERKAGDIMSDVTESTFKNGRQGDQPKIPRPNSAPAYYQGRPADLLIAALRPRRQRNGPHAAAASRTAAASLSGLAGSAAVAA